MYISPLTLATYSNTELQSRLKHHAKQCNQFEYHMSIMIQVKEYQFKEY